MKRLTSPMLFFITVLLTPSIGVSASAQEVKQNEQTELQEANPGDFLSLKIAFQDVSNGKYDIEGRLPQGWDLISNQVKVSNGYGVISLFLPDQALAGPHLLKFLLKKEKTVMKEATTTVKVAAHPAFMVAMPSNDRVRPRGQKSYTVTVSNTGNITDTVLLRIEGSAKISPSKLTLKPNETKKATIRYTHTNTGTADSLTVWATSVLAPKKQLENILAINVGEDGGTQNAPRMTWSLAVTPEITYGARVARRSPTKVPTLPGLPGSPSLIEAPEAWTWRGGVNASIGGDLSDYASGGFSYVLGRNEQKQLNDNAVARVDWENTSLTLSAQERFKQLGMEAQRTNGDLTFGVQARRQGDIDGDQYDVSGSVEHISGIYGWLGQSFGRSNILAIGTGAMHSWNNLSLRGDIAATRNQDRWGALLTQRLNYENTAVLAEQDYQYDSLQSKHSFNAKLAARQTLPFSVSGTLNVNNLKSNWRYNIAALTQYRPDRDFGAKMRLAYGSSGPHISADATKVWNFTHHQLYLAGKAQYVQNKASGDLQLTGMFPQDENEYLLTGLVGMEAGLGHYAAGAGFKRGSFSAGAGLNLQHQKADWTANAQYIPDVGILAGVDYLRRVEQQIGESHRLQGRLGYSTGPFQASLLGGVHLTIKKTREFLYGAQAAYQVTDALQLRGQAQRQGERIRAALGLRFTPGGAFNTPKPVVELFGGQKLGKLKVMAFTDLNRNNKRDKNEPAFTHPLQIGGREMKPKDGVAIFDLRPGPYNINLGQQVPAYYSVSTIQPIQVLLKKTVKIELPIQQTGRLQGQLKDETGKPLSGIVVQIGNRKVTQQAVTDAAGMYRVSNLPFGQHMLTIQANPALYKTPKPYQVALNEKKPLLNMDLKLNSIQEVHQLAKDALNLEVNVPEATFPPGVEVKVDIQVNNATEVTTEPAAQSIKQKEDGVWQAVITIPKNQKVPLEITAFAKNDKQKGSSSALVLVDPSLTASKAQVVPLHALPKQVIEIRAEIYNSEGQIAVRDENGQVTPLESLGDFKYRGQLKASDQSGNRELVLVVDGKDATKFNYNVLGPPQGQGQDAP